MLFWGCKVWTRMGWIQANSVLTHQLRDAAGGRSQCLSMISVPSFLLLPRLSWRLQLPAPGRSERWPPQTPLPALGSPPSSVGFSRYWCWPSVSAAALGSRCSKCPLFLCWRVLAGGTRGDPWIHLPDPASPSLLPALQPLEEFSTVGAVGSWRLSLQRIAAASEPGGSHLPLPSPQLLPWHLWHQDQGSHSHSRTGSAMSQLQPEGFSPILAQGCGMSVVRHWSECWGRRLLQCQGLQESSYR